MDFFPLSTTRPSLIGGVSLYLCVFYSRTHVHFVFCPTGFVRLGLFCIARFYYLYGSQEVSNIECLGQRSSTVGFFVEHDLPIPVSAGGPECITPAEADKNIYFF